MAINTRGVFSLEKIREKEIFDEWVNLDDVWISPSPSGIAPNTGYFGGGSTNSGLVSTMDKLTYSTDTTAVAPSGANLSSSRYRLAATGNSEAGYFGGGFPGPVSTMDKVTYSTDTTAEVPGASLSVARYALGASSARANAVAATTNIV